MHKKVAPVQEHSTRGKTGICTDLLYLKMCYLPTAKGQEQSHVVLQQQDKSHS